MALKMAGHSCRQAVISLFLIVGCSFSSYPSLAAVSHTAPTAQQLHDYARALSDILLLKRAVEQKAKIAAPSEQSILQEQMQFEITKILLRNGLSKPEFNRISNVVEQDGVLRRQVRQMLMEDIVGI